MIIRSCRAKAGPRTAVAASAVAMLFGMVACLPTRHQTTIALITPLTTSELWKGIHAGAFRAASGSAFSLYWNGPTHEEDSERQIALVKRQIDRRVAGIILVPDHASALIPVVEEALQRKIPIVLAGDKLAIAPQARVGIITSNERKAGEMAASVVGRLLGPRGQVIVAGVNPSSSSNLERVSAFERTLAEQFPGIAIVYKNYLTAGRTEDLDADLTPVLRRHPEVSAIFSPGLLGTRSAYAAIHEIHSSHAVHLVACDQDADEFEPLRRGEIDAIIAQDVFSMGYRAAQAIIQQRRSGTGLPSSVVDPILLTRENVLDPGVQQHLRPYSGYDR